MTGDDHGRRQAESESVFSTRGVLCVLPAPTQYCQLSRCRLASEGPCWSGLSQTSWWAPFTDGAQIWSMWGPCKPSPLGGQHMHSLSSTLQAPENAPVTGSAFHFGEMPSSCPLQQSPPSPQQHPGPGSPTDPLLWEGPLASSGSFLRRV